MLSILIQEVQEEVMKKVCFDFFMKMHTYRDFGTNYATCKIAICNKLKRSRRMCNFNTSTMPLFSAHFRTRDKSSIGAIKVNNALQTSIFLIYEQIETWASNMLRKFFLFL